MIRWNTSRRVFGFCVLICIALCVSFFARNALLPHAMRWLDISAAPVPTDATLMLLGDYNTRPFVAAALYNSGYTKQILLAHHKPYESDPYSPPSSVVARKILLKRGVPEEAIQTVGEGATNTMNESLALGEFLTDNPEAIVSVVTSHFHTRRTRWSMRLNLGKSANRLRFVSAPHDHFHEHNWWKIKRGFQLITMEYIKLLGYWVCYGNGLYWAGAIGVIALVWFGRRQRMVAASRFVTGATHA